VFLIAVLYIIAYIFVSTFAKYKDSTTVMLLGIEITIVGVAFVSFGSRAFSNSAMIYGFIGMGIVILGLCVNILGFRK
jgi:hypothetical protein